jgi:hypothetical protein
MIKAMKRPDKTGGALEIRALGDLAVRNGESRCRRGARSVHFWRIGGRRPTAAS